MYILKLKYHLYMASFDFVELLFSKSCKASDVEDIFGTI